MQSSTGSPHRLDPTTLAEELQLASLPFARSHLKSGTPPCLHHGRLEPGDSQGECRALLVGSPVMRVCTAFMRSALGICHGAQPFVTGLSRSPDSHLTEREIQQALGLCRAHARCVASRSLAASAPQRHAQGLVSTSWYAPCADACLCTCRCGEVHPGCGSRG